MKRIAKQNINTKVYWDARYHEGMNPQTMRLDEFKFDYISNYIKDNTIVVDLGCGTGEFCRELKLKRPECSVYGVDFSEEALRQAKAMGKGIKYLQGDVTDTRLADEVYDYVVSLETLEHMDKPQDLIKEAYRLLKPGGVLLLTTPYLDHIPSQEHIWEFEYFDVANFLMKLRFKQSWVYPWAAGFTEVRETESERLVYEKGHWCTIMALAIK